MKEKLELVRFNLTQSMTKELIKFNNLKKQLIELKQNKVLDKEKIIKIKKLENELNNTRIKFVHEFRENNQQEINKYLEMKDQF